MSDSSWNSLVAAHARVAAQMVMHDDASARPPKHKPNAAILACSDARVPPSVIFDQPAGNLFVIRLAGNTAVPSAVASLDYAVDVLGVDLIVVLGHTGCGAVAAAAGGTCNGHLEPIVGPICEIARQNQGADVDRIAALNVANTVAVLTAHSGPTGRGAASGHVEIRGALHDLATGRLVPVSTTNHSPRPSEAL